LPAEAEAVIRRVAAGMGSPVRSIAEEFGAGMMAADYPKTNLEGDYQRWNAATATLVARVLMRRAGGNGTHDNSTRDNGTRNNGTHDNSTRDDDAKDWRLTEGVIARGLQRVDWPGRWQHVVVGGQELILDASHNPEGARVLDDNLTHLRARLGGGESGKPIIVTGALGAQRARALLEVEARHARELHLVVPHQSRACSHEELEALVPRGFTGRVFHATVGELFPEPNRCALSDTRAPVVVTGSIYLIGEVFTHLQKGVKGEERLQDF
ncbi:MAG: hypothetical protein LBM04_08125, partial [Opitutaceae bacterium]|nr:hypothetical protein [Opitutaceae bacterium]